MSVFKLQSLLSIILDTHKKEERTIAESEALLASAAVTNILYTKPNGEKGSWTATVSGTKLIYNVQNGDIDQVGIWKFESYIEVGGLKGFGDIASRQFDRPLL
jgi:hypothetical protein